MLELGAQVDPSGYTKCSEKIMFPFNFADQQSVQLGECMLVENSNRFQEFVNKQGLGSTSTQ